MKRIYSWVIICIGACVVIIGLVAARGIWWRLMPDLQSVLLATPRPAPQRPTPGFTTLPPGSSLPSGATCATLVRRSAWEPRPQNASANQYIPVPGQDFALRNTWGGDATANARLQARIDGHFTGTTDEIIQWAACKWGVDEDLVRAMAVQESRWRQDAVGDNGLSFGLLQVKKTASEGSYPASATSTAFNLDVALGGWRACYEGNLTWLGANGSGYAAGDMWGCVGSYFAGKWYSDGAQQYIGRVRGNLQTRPWEVSDF
jgi:transglycosylase-like protein with SLT domain